MRQVPRLRHGAMSDRSPRRRYAATVAPRRFDRRGATIARVALPLLRKMHIRGDQRGLRPILDPQLFHDAPDVKFDSTFGDR